MVVGEQRIRRQIEMVHCPGPVCGDVATVVVGPEAAIQRGIYAPTDAITAAEETMSNMADVGQIIVGQVHGSPQNVANPVGVRPVLVTASALNKVPI